MWNSFAHDVYWWASQNPSYPYQHLWPIWSLLLRKQTHFELRKDIQRKSMQAWRIWKRHAKKKKRRNEILNQNVWVWGRDPSENSIHNRINVFLKPVALSSGAVGVVTTNFNLIPYHCDHLMQESRHGAVHISPLWGMYLKNVLIDWLSDHILRSNHNDYFNKFKSQTLLSMWTITLSYFFLNESFNFLCKS